MHHLGIRKIITGSALLLLLVPALFGHDGNHGVVFTSRLDVAQEVPAVTLEGNPRGLAGFKLNATCDTIRVSGAFQDLSSAISKFHVHSGVRGVAGPVAAELSGIIKGKTVSGNWVGFSGRDLRHLLRGAYYLNVHTNSHPAGEMRGQVEPERDALFWSDLKGSNEVPANASLAAGVAYFSLSPDDSILTVEARFQGLSDSVTAAHIHQGPAGANGGVVVNLLPFLVGDVIKGSVRIAGLAAPAAFLDSLRKGSLYLNVHSKAHPAGEIRGQLTPDKGIFFTAGLKGSNEVPAVHTDAAGTGFFSLSDNDSDLTVQVVFGSLKDDITAAHLHRAAPGANGPVAVNLFHLISGNSLSGRFDLTCLTDREALLDDLVKGNVYVNIHTKAHPSGEIRGQLLLPARSGFAFALSGAQEVPAADSRGTGVGIATSDAGRTNLRYEVLVDGLGSAFKAAHLHKGAKGTNGGIALNITSAFKENRAAGTWTDRDATPFTKELAGEFHAGGLYLNVHTEKFAAGELRGQSDDQDPGKSVAIRALRSGSGGALAEPRREAGSFRFPGRPGESVTATFTDLSGKVRLLQTATVGADAYTGAVDIRQLRSGFYFLRWSAGGAVHRSYFLVP